MEESAKVLIGNYFAQMLKATSQHSLLQTINERTEKQNIVNSNKGCIMWKAAIALGVIFLSGCNPSYEDKNASYSLPPEMQDCRVYKLHGDAISRDIVVVRCPNSQTTTSYSYGKNGQSHTTVIE